MLPCRQQCYSPSQQALPVLRSDILRQNFSSMCSQHWADRSSEMQPEFSSAAAGGNIQSLTATSWMHVSLTSA